jgi:hypothetical protein
MLIFHVSKKKRQGAGAHLERANNLNTGANDAFYVGSGNLSDGDCRINTGVTYLYQPLEFECNGETYDLCLSINATTTEELTATLDNFNSCPSLGVTSDMLNTLKISIANWGDARDGVVHLSSIKFNEIEIGDFCLEGKGRGGFRDILVDLGGYDFQEGAVVTGNLVPCGAKNDNFDKNEAK